MKFQPEGNLFDTNENQFYLKNIECLKEAFVKNKIIEARTFRCDANHNLHVDLGEIQGVIPRENGAIGLDDGSVRDIAVISKVNKPVSFFIERFSRDENGNTFAILNRKAVQKKCIDEYISNLRSGDIIDAKICHMESFGAFADIGAGINSLLPIDSISVSRIPHPSARFSSGQNIRAVVKSRDDMGRIILSHKELLGTWEDNAKNFCVGDTVSGIVRSIEKYGIFVELAPNLAGLAEYTDNISPGQSASVYIKSIIPERMKIKLIIVDAFDDSHEKPKTYYFFKSNHISSFVYSPASSDRKIEYVFDNE